MIGNDKRARVAFDKAIWNSFKHQINLHETRHRLRSLLVAAQAWNGSARVMRPLCFSLKLFVLLQPPVLGGLLRDGHISTASSSLSWIEEHMHSLKISQFKHNNYHSLFLFFRAICASGGRQLPHLHLPRSLPIALSTRLIIASGRHRTSLIGCRLLVAR